MPIAFHTDILYIHFFPSYLSYAGVWDVYGHLAGRFAEHGFTYYQPGIYFVIGLFQWLTKSLNPGFDAFIGSVETLMTSVVDHRHWELGELLARFRPAEIRRFAFFMKLPYLAADVLCALFICRAFADSKERSRALALWLFHPVNLFSAYIFGQYRLWPAVFVWLALLFAGNKKHFLALAALGTAALFDDFPFLLLMPALLIFGKDTKEKVLLGISFTLPLAAVLVPLALPDDWKWVGYSYTSEVIQRTVLQSITHSFWKTWVAFGTKILLAAFYAALLWTLGRKRCADSDSAGLFAHAGLAVLLAVYATTGTMVHYTQWALPFFVALMARGEPWPRKLTWLWVGALFLFNLDTREMNLGLFAPLDASLASLPSLHERMDAYLPWGTVVAASRWLFSGLSAYFVWSLWRSRIRPLLVGR